MWMIFFLYSCLCWAADKPTFIDALLARVGREAVTASDVERYKDVDEILTCAKLRVRENPLSSNQHELLNSYLDEELMFQEAKVKKITISGLTQDTVRMIHSKPECKQKWQSLGNRYLNSWKTPTHPREGQSLLVRELEKRILVDKFRKSEMVGDIEVWRREAKTRYPIKIYLE